MPYYNTKAAYILMKLDCMLQQSEAIGWADLDEIHDFVVTFKSLPRKHQKRYGHLLDEMGDLFDLGEQPCE